MTEGHDWAGRVGVTWAAEWRRTDRAFGTMAARLNAAIAAAAPETGRALDIGCGAGATSLALAAARPRLKVTGGDISPAQVAAARERGRDLANLDFVAGDVLDTARTLAPIDLMVSRHGVMFFADPVAAFAALHGAASPDARLVFSCFRSAEENSWMDEIAYQVDGAPPPIRGNAPGPFAFGDRARVTKIFADAGWRDVTAEPVDYATRVGEGDDAVADAVSFFGHIGPAASRLRELAPAEREAALARIAAVCAERQQDGVVEFPAAAWIWTAHA